MFFNLMKGIVGGFLILFVVYMVCTFSSKEYEVQVSSDTMTQDVSQWDVQAIIDAQGKPVPAKEWDKVLESGNFVPVSVASLELRKRYTQSEREY